LIQHTGYTERDLIDVILRIRVTHWQARDYPIHSFINYFMDEARYEVANIFALPYSQLRFARVDQTENAYTTPVNEMSVTARMAIYAYYGLPKEEQLYDLPDFAKGNGIPPYAKPSKPASSPAVTNHSRVSASTTTSSTSKKMNQTTKNIEQLLFGNSTTGKKKVKTNISPVSTVDSIFSQ
jgi:hypothetical protein